MSDGPITLKFIARQQARILDRLGDIEDQVTAVTGICLRLDGSMQGLSIKVRAIHSRVDWMGRRLTDVDRAVGDRLPAA